MLANAISEVSYAKFSEYLNYKSVGTGRNF